MKPRSFFDPDDTLRQMEDIEASLDRLLNHVDEAAFQKPSPRGGWSPAYCMEHLLISGEAFNQEWNRVLSQPGLPPPSTSSARYGLFAGLFLRMLEPPYRLRIRTGPTFNPAQSHTRDQTRASFLAMHDEMRRHIERSRRTDAGTLKIQSPFSTRVRYPLGFSFDASAAHERRHLWQADQAAG